MRPKILKSIATVLSLSKLTSLLCSLGKTVSSNSNRGPKERSLHSIRNILNNMSKMCQDLLDSSISRLAIQTFQQKIRMLQDRQSSEKKKRKRNSHKNQFHPLRSAAPKALEHNLPFMNNKKNMWKFQRQRQPQKKSRLHQGSNLLKDQTKLNLTGISNMSTKKNLP